MPILKVSSKTNADSLGQMIGVWLHKTQHVGEKTRVDSGFFESGLIHSDFI